MSSVPVAQQLELGGVVFIVTLGTVGEEPSIGSLLLTVVIHLPLFRPLHTKAFLQKLRARRALLRNLGGPNVRHWQGNRVFTCRGWRLPANIMGP